MDPPAEATTTWNLSESFSQAGITYFEADLWPTGQPYAISGELKVLASGQRKSAQFIIGQLLFTEENRTLGTVGAAGFITPANGAKVEIHRDGHTLAGPVDVLEGTGLDERLKGNVSFTLFPSHANRTLLLAVATDPGQGPAPTQATLSLTATQRVFLPRPGSRVVPDDARLYSLRGEGGSSGSSVGVDAGALGLAYADEAHLDFDEPGDLFLFVLASVPFLEDAALGRMDVTVTDYEDSWTEDLGGTTNATLATFSSFEPGPQEWRVAASGEGAFDLYVVFARLPYPG